MYSSLTRTDGQQHSGHEKEVDVEKGMFSEPGLPFPSLSKGNSGFTIRYIEINNLRKPALVDLCRQYQLPISGNMKTLMERLQEFSSEREKWDRLGQSVARRSHLGSHSSTKASNPKKSLQRREKMFESANTAETPVTRPFPSILSTAVPAQRWNQVQHVADINWALYILNLYPYRKEATRKLLAEQDAARLNKSRLASGSNDDALKAGIEIANSHLTKIVNWVEASAMPPNLSPKPSAAIPQDPEPFVFHDQPHHSTQNLLNVSKATSQPTQRLSTIPTRSVTLASGIIFFTVSDVPPPPVVSFAHNIPALNRMWDDTSIHWDGHSVLKIKGTPIPIIYWKEVYTSKYRLNWKPKQWESLKGKFFDWKVLVKRWRQGSPEDFWTEFTENGQPMCYRMILNRLAEQRTVQDAATAQKIKEEYGDDFSTVFSYVKNGVRHVKTKPCHIIKQYHKLKGIYDDNDDFDNDD